MRRRLTYTVLVYRTLEPWNDQLRGAEWRYPIPHKSRVFYYIGAECKSTSSLLIILDEVEKEAIVPLVSANPPRRN